MDTAVSERKVGEWIAAEATFRLLAERFGGDCDHTCCGRHPAGERSMAGCLDCIRERAHFWLVYSADPLLYVAAIEATLRLPADAPF